CHPLSVELAWRVALQLFADFPDQRGDRLGIVGFRFSQTLGGDTGRVGGERREAAFLGVSDDSGKLEKLLGDFRVQAWLLHLHPVTLRRFGPALSEGLEELVHQARTLAPLVARRGLPE